MSEASSAESLPAQGVLANLSPAERDTLLYFGEIIAHKKGDDLVQQGYPQAYLHLVLEGELRVIIKSEESVLPLAYIQPGECVGEMSLLEPIEASATVKANANTKVWCLSRDRFEEFCEQHPIAANKFLKAIAIMLARRLRKGSQRLLESK